MTRLKHFFRESFRNRALIIMALPGIILIFMFSYVPMYGALVAFKKFDYMKGIWGSPWTKGAFDNFRFFFLSGKASSGSWARKNTSNTPRR